MSDKTNDDKTAYYQKNSETILNRAIKKYYNDNKERWREKARNKCRELSEKEKNIKTEYGRNRYHRYHTTSEDKTKKVKKYQKNNPKAKKS